MTAFWSTLFCYNVDEMLWELSISLRESGLRSTLFCLKSQNAWTMLNEDLLYMSGEAMTES